ncbi:DUF4124 domain-containing protein [Methyloradius palustris]|uniref:DUF4124 domain-containing protein n=1 Tax=Methyloradius palustris TaxID=2778876 RepID=A0A8D5G6A7_9PROT|nr:DUF4124 domain-containing protein [Methyloradius palustris]BCM24081.1 hypothetical protein ZMTM_03400 [Methyloradius palustris]
MRSIKPIIIMLGLLLASSYAHAGITKWTDADGKVHYSDQPAPKNVKATNITIEDPIPVAPDAQKKLQSYQNVIEEGRKKRQLEQQQQDEKAAKEAADKKAAAAAAKLAAKEAAKKAENDAAQGNANAGLTLDPKDPGYLKPDAAGYTGYGNYSGYTPLAAPAAPAATP